MRLQVARIAEVNRIEFFASFVEGEQLKIGRCVVEPGHAFGSGAPCACRHNHFEPAEVAASIGFLAAVVEPENAESKNTVDHGRGLGLADADYGISRSAAQQAAADIGGA